jgi:antitoxin component YwqK of YwqJK toxin-antitoxin module
MKNFFLIAVVTLITVITGCKTASPNLVEERGGIIYDRDSNQPFSGMIVDYYPDGRKKLQGNFENGKACGIHREWYENRQLKSMGNFENGKLDGKMIAWNKDGSIKFTKTYKNGRLVKDVIRKKPAPPKPKKK